MNDTTFDPTADPLERAKYWICLIDDNNDQRADEVFPVADAIMMAQTYALLAQVEQLQRIADMMDTYMGWEAIRPAQPRNPDGWAAYDATR